MAMYRFSVASFTAVACRSKEGQDDVWVIVTVSVGTRSGVEAWPVAFAVQAGQGVALPWSAGSEWATGPYQAAVGEAGVVAYTLVNLGGSGGQHQEKIIESLQNRLGVAVGGAVGGGAAAIEAAIRGQFGGAGELLAAPAVVPGFMDCRGLVGVHVAPFTVAQEPSGEEVQTTDPISLTGTAPSACGTTPQSNVAFSVGRSPNVFSQSTPVTALVSGTGLVEIFAVGMDGFVRRNARGAGGGAFGAWQVVGSRTFSQSAALVAVAGMAQRKDVFGTGTDGVIYWLTWTQAAGWGDWAAVSALGQFLPDTPVSAIAWNGGMLSLFAVDPDGVAQSMTRNGDAVVSAWAPLPTTVFAPSTSQASVVFARRTPLLAMSHVDNWVEVFAVDSLGQDFHTSHGPDMPWSPWERLGASPLAIEPSSRRYLGLNFNAKRLQDGSMQLGMAWFRVDGRGKVNQLGWTQDAGWIGRNIIAGLSTTLGGAVSGVRLGNQLLLYMVDEQTGQVAVTSWTSPFPFFSEAWSAWTLVPAGPSLAKEREITAVSTDDSHVEIFVVDREGLVQHMILDTSPNWNPWLVV